MGAPFTPVDYVAAQLTAAAPGADWFAQGVDRARELAAIFVREGITDLAGLAVVPYKVTSTQAFYEPTVSYGYAFTWRGRPHIGFMGTPDRADHQGVFQDGLMLAWSAAGHGHVSYVIQPSANGFSIVPIWGSSSDWGVFHDIVKFFGPIVLVIILPAAGIELAGTLGSAVVGPELAAAYPGLATTVGNVALSTAMNGGDVESAVKNAAAGYVGASVGGVVAGASDVQVIGSLAGSATAALVQGKDINSALAHSLLGYGASDKGSTVDDFSYADDVVSAQNAAAADNEVFGNIDAVDIDAMIAAGSQVPTAYGTTPVFNLTTPAYGGEYSGLMAPAADTSSPIPTAAQHSGDETTFTPTNIIKTISQAAMATLNIAAAARSLSGGINTTARLVSANGAVTVAGDDGLITTRNPNGSISSTRPTVGAPQATLSGGLVINNGNGTYDLIDQYGNRVTRNYALTTNGLFTGGGLSGMLSGLSPTTLAIGAAALIGGVFLLSRPRRA